MIVSHYIICGQYKPRAQRSVFTADKDLKNYAEYLDLLLTSYIQPISPKQDKAVSQYCGRITFGSIDLYFMIYSELCWYLLDWQC